MTSIETIGQSTTVFVLELMECYFALSDGAEIPVSVLDSWVTPGVTRDVVACERVYRSAMIKYV